jgi:hypothetical protein
MRAAGAVFPDDRVQSIQAMHAEARRIKERVLYAKDIEAVKARRVPSDDFLEEAEEVLEKLGDEDEWWRVLQNAGPQSKRRAKEMPKRKATLTPLEATEELMNTFHPMHESVAESQRLLEANANPNAPTPTNRLSPLRHVILFAPANTVGKMRDLLLKHGATESEDDK